MLPCYDRKEKMPRILALQVHRVFENLGVEMRVGCRGGAVLGFLGCRSDAAVSRCLRVG